MLIKSYAKTCVTAWEIVILLSERAGRTEPNRTEPAAKHLYTPFKYTEAVKLLKNDKNLQNNPKSIRSDIKGCFEEQRFFKHFLLGKNLLHAAENTDLRRHDLVQTAEIKSLRRHDLLQAADNKNLRRHDFLHAAGTKSCAATTSCTLQEQKPAPPRLPARCRQQKPAPP